jgi:hypothetical protein
MSDKRVIKLCCGGKGCPTIEKKGKTHVVITDDYGNQITIKNDEAKLISDALKEL